MYEFWGESIAANISTELKNHDHKIIVNCASNEYFKSISNGSLEAMVITPEFKEIKNGSLKMISFYAKKARGLMAAWILKNKIKENKLNNFNSDGYYFSPEESYKNSPVFLRD